MQITIEECMMNSRGEAIQLAMKIEQMLEDAYDAGMAQAACWCSCHTSDYHVIANIFKESTSTGQVRPSNR